ncbi:hypothetical protein J7643_06720 [bacterium]|nr:hypothetical protein [bacterium]
MNIQKVAFFISLTLLVGCRPAGLLQLPSTTQSDGSQGATAQQDPQARKGSLAIAIKWPELSRPGFNAQVIPKTTRALVVTIADADDQIILREQIDRPAQGGSDAARREFFLNEGVGYQVQVEAHEGVDGENGKVVLVGKPIASAFKTGIEIKWNKKTSVPLPLDATYAPSIAGISLESDFSVSTDHAGAGAELYLAGQNLTWPASGLSEVIFPSGKVVTALSENAGNTLRFTVPTGAGSGNLRLRVNGVQSVAEPFYEVKTLNLTAAKGGADIALDDFGGDGIVRSWLGESFPFVTFGTDSSDSVLVSINSKFSNTNGTVGAINGKTGIYQANVSGFSGFGEDVVTAKSGSVETTRKVVVSPPAGIFIDMNAEPPLGAPASDPIGGLSVAKIDENRFIGAWFDRGNLNDQADDRVYWQLFNRNGIIAGTRHSVPAFYRDTIRMVRVAVQGETAMVAYTLTNGFGLTTVDLQTGAPKQTLTYDNAAANQFFRLGNLAATNETFMVTYYGMVNSKLRFNYAILKVAGDGAISEVKRQPLPIILYDNAAKEEVEVALNDNTVDNMGISVSTPAPSSSYTVAFHFVGLSGSLFDEFFEFDDKGFKRNGAGFPRSNHRAISLAENASHYMTVAVDATENKVKAYRYGKADPFNGTNTPAIEVDTQAVIGNPQDHPTSVVWNGTEFLVAYTKNVVINGEAKPRPMVRAIAADGTFKGPAYPIANLGTSPMLIPTDEGAMAFWLSSTKKLVARRLKYH